MKITYKNLQKALEASWDKDTIWPGATWKPKNPSCGHCRVSSTVAQTLLGGEILKVTISEKPLKTHFWNKIDGKECDFTIAQFPEDFKMPKGKKISVKEVMSAPQIQKTYPILLGRVKKYLGI
ncbi:MAG: hypothetical protein HQ536_03565 [Parcubacteria group bacterium]|nr:hypothetical protein [Parcubacteria group bacterium]